MALNLFAVFLLRGSLSQNVEPPPTVTKSGEVITVRQGKSIKWKSHVECKDVLVVPYMRCIIYVDARTTFARTYSGKFLWKHDNVGYGSTGSLCAGKNHLFKYGYASITFGMTPTWRFVLGVSFVDALDLRTGKLLWSDVARNMGRPVWANETYFLSIGMDTSPLLHEKKQPLRLKTYLEVRQVKYGRLVRRVRIPGLPRNEQIRRINGKSVEMKCLSYEVPLTPRSVDYVKSVKRPFTVRVRLEEAKAKKRYSSVRYHFDELL